MKYLLALLILCPWSLVIAATVALIRKRKGVMNRSTKYNNSRQLRRLVSRIAAHKEVAEKLRELPASRFPRRTRRHIARFIARAIYRNMIVT